MSSWTNYGLSALSNVTQSVQALSSYAQVVLHEARQEVAAQRSVYCCPARHLFAPSSSSLSLSLFPEHLSSFMHQHSFQVESELLGQENPLETSSPTPNDDAQAAVDDQPLAFASRASIISPPRTASASRVAAADDYASSSASAAMAARADFSRDDDSNGDIVQLQVSVSRTRSPLLIPLQHLLRRGCNAHSHTVSRPTFGRWSRN